MKQQCWDYCHFHKSECESLGYESNSTKTKSHKSECYKSQDRVRLIELQSKVKTNKQKSSSSVKFGPHTSEMINCQKMCCIDAAVLIDKLST